VEDSSGLLRLDRNELTHPISETVSRAVARHLEEVGSHLYPEVGPLAKDIGAYCDVEPGCVVATNGSDQAIDVALRAFLAEGDQLVIAAPEFPMFALFAGLIGVAVARVPYLDDLSFPYDDFREALAATSPDLIAFVNPNNPTGTPVIVDFIDEIAGSYPDVPVVVDEAYYEFTGRTVVPLTQDHDNLIVLRTFSKAFGLAGLRLGYMVAARPVVEQITKLLGPYDVNALAIAAARAQLAAIDEVHSRVDETMAVKPMVVDFLTSVGDTVWPGAANFVLVRPVNGSAVVDHLRDNGILVRRMHADRLQGTYRMSLGTSDEMERFVSVYERMGGA
jgi:histidinol-phosphate aminotransferase